MSRVNFSDCFLETSDTKLNRINPRDTIINAKSEESFNLNEENIKTLGTTNNINKNREDTNFDNTVLNVKFIAPRYKIENKFPESKKSLNEHVLDMVSLKDKNSEYCMQRNE